MRRVDGRTDGRTVGQSRGSWASLGLVVGLFAACPPDRLAAQTIAITEATIYPVSGPKIERGTVLVRDGRIVALGADVAIPGDARRIDGRGKVVTPGFFHAQSALGLGVGRSLAAETDEEYTAIGGTTDGGQSGDINASFNVLAGVDPNGIAFPVARRGGITTAVVMPSGGLVAGQAIVLRLSGRSSGEMLVRSPVGMVVDLGDGSRPAGGGSRAGAVGRAVSRAVDRGGGGRCVVGSPAAVDAGCEDGDALGPLVDLTAEALPGAVAGHPRGVGALGQDQPDVVGRVAVEAGGHAQVPGPILTGHQGLDLGDEAVVQLPDLVGLVGAGHGGAHGRARGWRRATTGCR